MRQKDMYDVGIYCRLSRDDNNGSSESMSIANQKQMLKSYVTEKGWNVKEIYVDDGYSGTNFSRPDFERMVKDIEAGKINLVITKDQSRLGRDYIMTGYYTDIIFPRYKVRYIALNDNYDSTNKNNDIAPFRNILNEMYAGDISKKVKSSKISGAKQGKFLGSLPPYGYTKSPIDKHKLIVDENVAHIVKRIFNRFAAGDSARNIANELNEEGTPSPSEYHFEQVRRERNPHGDKLWGSASVFCILKNQVHLGHMAQGKKTMISFKSKDREEVPEDEWIIVKDTHEALIESTIWSTVQKRIISEKRARVTNDGEIGLFSGLLKCADCGSAMTFTTKTQRSKSYFLYRCSRYANSGKSGCTIHSIPIESLSAVVLDDIKQYASLAESDEETLAKTLAKHMNESKNKELSDARADYNNMKTHSTDIDIKMEKLFEEKIAGNIPDAFFKKMMHDYEESKENFTKKMNLLKNVIYELEAENDNISEWVQRVKSYVSINELDRDIVTDLIEKIEVAESTKIGKAVERNITIWYKFVGCLNIAA